MKGNLTIVDKKTEFGTFRYEERIKSSQFQENIDYTFDEIKGIYTILSPQLAKDILIIQNPYNENIEVSDIVIKVLVDYRSEINIKPQIVIDLEKRENLIEINRGRNNFPQSLPPSGIIREIEDGRIEVIEDKKNQEKTSQGRALVRKIKERKRDFEFMNLINIDTKEVSQFLISKSAKFDDKNGLLLNCPEMYDKRMFSEEQWNKIEGIISGAEQTTGIIPVFSESQENGFQLSQSQKLAIETKFISFSKESSSKLGNNVAIYASVVVFFSLFLGIFLLLNGKKTNYNKFRYSSI
jgi:hypothetical protein